MTRRVLTIPSLLAGMFALSALAADTKADAAKAKKALQDVGDFVGQWNLEGQSKAGGKSSSWKEIASWGWKFKDADARITVDFKDGKFFSKGDLRYLPEKKLYKLTLAGKDGQEQVFTGEYKRQKLVLERTDDKTGDVHRVSMNTLSEGVRFAMQYEVQSGGKGLFETKYKAAGTKEGESFAGGKANKKPDCIVTGGAGTMAVTYMGKTYYVCCSGCKEEFEANPKKYVDAFEKGKK
jgi:YHS domain-containing protein